MSWGLMKTFDALPEDEQRTVMDLADEVREAMRARGLLTVNDDRAAIFDEACAVYYVQCRDCTKEKEKEKKR